MTPQFTLRLSRIRIIFLLLLSSTSLHAEDPKIGRLEDGRAYRTDHEGNQLVDYLAELELSNESLKRQVMALEEDVRVKNQLIERGGKEERLEERTLVGRKEEQPSLQPVLLRSQEAEKKCQAELKELRTALDKTTQEAPRAALSARTLSDAQTELQRAQKAMEELRESHANEAETQQQKQTELLALVTLKDKQLQELQAKNKELTYRLSARVVPAREQVFAAMQGKIATELNRVSGVLETRDSLFNRYYQERKNTGVTFRPSMAVSSAGHSLQELRGVLKQASSVQDFSQIGRETEEIRRVLEGDIALINRMLRSQGR